MSRGWLGAAAILAAAAGCAESDEPSLAHRALAVSGGQTDGGHASVVFVQTVPSAPLPELCTGTVIGKRAVLTAAHCAVGQTPASLTVGVGVSVKSPERVVPVAAVVPYPRYGLGPRDEELGLDLGLVITAEDLGLDPIPLAEEATLGAAVLVGYGQSDPDDQQTRGTRRSAPVVLDAVCSTLARFGNQDGNACHGDSGGPLLVELAGQTRLAGVVSYGGKSCAPPTFAVRVAPFRAWVEAVAASGMDDPTCTGCPDTPATCSADAGAEAGAAGGGAAGGAAGAAGASDAAATTAPAGASASGEVAGGCGVVGRPSSRVDALAVVLAVLALRRRRRQGG